LFVDPSQCGEAGEIDECFLDSRGCLGTGRGVNDLDSDWEQEVLEKSSLRELCSGSFASKHLPCSSAFLLLGTDLSPLALDHGFLGAAEK
jgi:hypothetical protein